MALVMFCAWWFCAFLIAVLISLVASMVSQSKAKDIDGLIISWAESIQRRCLSVIRKHYKMLAFMGLLRCCGVFEISYMDAVDELIWVLYAISCETDELESDTGSANNSPKPKKNIPEIEHSRNRTFPK